jgi:hypothetical protein
VGASASGSELLGAGNDAVGRDSDTLLDDLGASGGGDADINDSAKPARSHGQIYLQFHEMRSQATHEVEVKKL